MLGASITWNICVCYCTKVLYNLLLNNFCLSVLEQFQDYKNMNLFKTNKQKKNTNIPKQNHCYMGYIAFCPRSPGKHGDWIYERPVTLRKWLLQGWFCRFDE